MDSRSCGYVSILSTRHSSGNEQIRANEQNVQDTLFCEVATKGVDTMASSVLNHQTKMLLVSALKSLMKTIKLDRVTISDITKACGVSRRAFYYHFEDIYEAAIWMFEQDLGGVITLSDHQWSINIGELLEYVESNKVICLNAIRSSQGYRLEELVYAKIKGCMASYLLSLCKRSSLEIKNIELISDCYTISMLAIIKSWLDGTISCSREELLSLFEQTIEGSVASVIESFDK